MPPPSISKLSSRRSSFFLRSARRKDRSKQPLNSPVPTTAERTPTLNANTGPLSDRSQLLSEVSQTPVATQEFSETKQTPQSFLAVGEMKARPVTDQFAPTVHRSASQGKRRQSLGSIRLQNEVAVRAERQEMNATVTAKMANKSPLANRRANQRRSSNELIITTDQPKEVEEKQAAPHALAKGISIDITPSQDLVPSLLIVQNGDGNTWRAPTPSSLSTCSTDSTSLATPVSFAPSPRLDDIRSRLANKQNELDLRLQKIARTFSELDDDLKLASTRSLPMKKPVPMLSLFTARQIVHEETEQGAVELDYAEEARLIAEEIKRNGRLVSAV